MLLKWDRLQVKDKQHLYLGVRLHHNSISTNHAKTCLWFKLPKLQVFCPAQKVVGLAVVLRILAKKLLYALSADGATNYCLDAPLKKIANEKSLSPFCYLKTEPV